MARFEAEMIRNKKLQQKRRKAAMKAGKKGKDLPKVYRMSSAGGPYKQPGMKDMNFMS